MKKINLLALAAFCTTFSFAQSNTAPIPDGYTKIGGHLWAGAANEVWTETGSNTLYFNYRGTGITTYFWNLQGSTGHSVLTIHKNDRVGIGTNHPSAQLDINGLQGVTDTRTFRVRYFDLENQYIGGTELSGLAHVNGYWTALYAAQGNASSSAFFDGKVGIGTPTPKNLLDVNGTIRAKEVKVESGWADFVFKPDYQLRPLSEVELFINTNGHLPEIPTEKEVTQNGISLGEMNAKLLQKVEELTLYIIQQNKRIDSLVNQNKKTLKINRK